MSLCAIDALVAECAARELVPLLDESVTGAFCTLDQFSFGLSLLTDTVVEILSCQPHYHLFDASRHTTEVGTFF